MLRSKSFLIPVVPLQLPQTHHPLAQDFKILTSLSIPDGCDFIAT